MSVGLLHTSNASNKKYIDKSLQVLIAKKERERKGLF